MLSLTGAALTYQWSRSDEGTDTDISRATDSTYTLVSEDLGNSIIVRVSFTDDAEVERSVASIATGAVAAAPLNLSDLNVSDDPNVLAGALVRVGDQGRRTNGTQDRAWYAWIRPSGTPPGNCGTGRSRGTI